MDSSIALRLDNRKGNPFYDAGFSSKVTKTARDYIDAGLQALNFHIADFDAATDLVEMYAPVENQATFDKMDRNAAINMRHPMAFIEMVTLTTFVAQILFGGEQARSVEAQGEDDQPKADNINALLAYNDSKLGIYMIGWLWCWNAIVYNRGIWYESTDQDVTVEREAVDEPDLSAEKIPVLKQDGTPRTRSGKPVFEYAKKTRWRNKRTRTGFFNKLDIVSPYDFICDPTLPFMRFQEGRFAGHRVMIPWHDLKRRSQLDPTDDDYVLPAVVDKIKTNRGSGLGMTPSALGGTQGANSSRTYFERQSRAGAVSGTGIAASNGGGDAVNKDDGGIVECFLLQIRAKPKTLDMYEDDEFELIQTLCTAAGEVLSLNVRPNKHDEFPYAPGEGFPSAHRQFSPGFGLKVKPCQDRVDDLNLTHSTAQKRMGNILLIDPTKCDVANLLSRDKNGLMIFRTAQGNGVPAEEIVKQIPLTDTTAKYPDEMAMWEKTAENVTGAHAFVQGQTEDPSQTLGQFDSVKQMAVGRISSVARMLSEQALKPQTRRFAMNFQQFCDEVTTVRVLGKGKEFDPDAEREDYKKINKADIQCGFDVVSHDGSLPGADAKIVAAASRALEVAASNPMLQSAFDKTQPGAMDPVAIFVDLLKKSGLPVQKYQTSTEQAQRNQTSALQSQGIFQPPQQVDSLPGSTAPMQPNGLPSAAQLPPIPTAAPLSAHPQNV